MPFFAGGVRPQAILSKFGKNLKIAKTPKYRVYMLNEALLSNKKFFENLKIFLVRPPKGGLVEKSDQKSKK